MGNKRKTTEVLPKKPTSLPWLETRIYITVHILVVIYIIYCVYKASNKYDGLLNVYDFEPGWSVLHREKDASNYEWYFFYKLFWAVGPMYIVYIAVDWIASQHLSSIHRRYAGLSLSMVLLIYVLGWKSLTLLCVHTVTMLLISSFHSRVLIWIASIALISTLNFEPFVTWMKLLNPEDFEGKSYYLLMFTLALVHLRYTSFCLEYIQENPKTSNQIPPDFDVNKPDSNVDTPRAGVDKPVTGVDTDRLYMELDKKVKDHDGMKFSVIDAFVYIFYFPLFFCGPIITFDEFSKQMKESSKNHLTKDEKKYIVFQAIRMIFWAFLNEFILHYLYFNALQHNLSVVQDMDLWTLSGIGYCQGQFFMTKYTVMFGLPSVVARICGLDPPAGPKCIAHIYTYSDMWKYFDRGMYSFIKRYIYVPLGGSQGNILEKLLRSLACFIFVYIWHGIEYYIFLWALFNFIGVSLETVGRLIEKQNLICKVKNFMPVMYLRIQALVMVPLFIMSTFTAFCFFGGSMIGYMYYKKFIIQGWLKSWVVFIFVVYCCIQSSSEIHRWQRQKEKKQ